MRQFSVRHLWYVVRILEIWKSVELFLDNWIKFWKLHCLQIFVARIWNFLDCPRDDLRLWFWRPRSSRDRSKNCKIPAAKTAINATLRTWFYCLEKQFCRFSTFSRLCTSHIVSQSSVFQSRSHVAQQSRPYYPHVKFIKFHFSEIQPGLGNSNMPYKRTKKCDHKCSKTATD